MGRNRVFLPQDTLDRWLDEGRVAVEGERMTLQPEDQRFRLASAVRFVEELAGEGDTAALVGKVKDFGQLEALGGEHQADSVLLGDAAYQVVEGFVGEPVDAPPGPPSEPGSGEIDLLAKLFMAS